MKSYLDLVPIFTGVHKRQNRMTVFCIVLSVFLITGIFSMADMFIRSQILQARKDDGNWHIAVRDITDEQAALIAARPDVKSAARYGVRNYNADEAYTMGGKNVMLCGCDEAWLTEMMEGVLEEGIFPQTDTEALVTQNARKQLGLRTGSTIFVDTPDGRQLQFVVSGFISDAAKVLEDDSFGLCMTTEAMRKQLFPAQSGNHLEDYNSLLVVRFVNTVRLQTSIEAIKNAFELSDGQITENLKLTGLLWQSGSTFMSWVYASAAILTVLVMLAGMMMISGSLSSSVAQKIEFYGMIRCIGATPKQVMKLVRREALCWCRFAIPAGLFAALGTVWTLCAVMRLLSPDYFSEMPVFAVSLPGSAAGVTVGLITVLIAAYTPAKRASKASPLAAVSGNANDVQPVHKAVNTRFCKIETALGIYHAAASKRTFFLMTGSFAFSVVLFLAFSVTVAFMHNTLTPLRAWTPDLSIISGDNSLSVEAELLSEIQQNPSVNRAFGRRFAYHISSTVNGRDTNVDLISYESYQFHWAEEYVLHTSRDAIQTVQQQPLTGLALYRPNSEMQIQEGDIVSLTINGHTEDIQILGMLSQCPFNMPEDVIICSEETFYGLTGQENYTIIDVQLKRGASETDIETIQKMAGFNNTFSDRRLSNRSVQGAYYSFSLCVYGFLVLIAFITICNIVNSIALSVTARTKQYGTFRAIGLSSRQLSRMVVAEASTYAVTGCIAGTVLGLICNKFLFDLLISRQWGTSWNVPWPELRIIVLIVLFSVAIAVFGPIKRLRNISIADTVNAP